MKKINRSNGGFSLVEIIVAVVILGIITVPLLHTLLAGARTARTAADTQDVTTAAQNLVESVRAVGAGKVHSGDGWLGLGEGISEKLSGGIKTVEFESYTSGARQYRAVVTIAPDGAKNDEPLAKSNPMDITFNMKNADDEAKNDFVDACKIRVPELDEDGEEIGFHYDYPDESWLERNAVVFSAERRPRADGAFDYTVSLIFEYVFAGGYGFSPYSKSVELSDTTENVSTPEYGDAAFSVYLIYDAYFQRGTEEISVGNSYSDADFNLFLVNSSESAAPQTYGCELSYKNQLFSDGDTCVRVFANHKIDRYTAYDTNGAGLDLTDRLTNSLVEVKAEQRRYNVSVSVFEPGGDTALHTIDAEMMV